MFPNEMHLYVGTIGINVSVHVLLKYNELLKAWYVHFYGTDWNEDKHNPTVLMYRAEKLIEAIPVYNAFRLIAIQSVERGSL